MPSAAAAALAALAPIAVPAQQEPAHDAEPDVTAEGTATTGIVAPATTPAATTTNGTTPNGAGPTATQFGRPSPAP
jgi:hypothetical protein